jgi:homocysteine S-methyltransferase
MSNQISLLDELQRRVVVADGAMGTMLQSRGFQPNWCFEELNLSQPSVIRQIHSEYLNAGAEILETNTFGANRLKLESPGFASQLRDINAEGVRLARQAALEFGKQPVWIAGSIGPLGIRIEPWGAFSVEEAREVFREQAAVLADAGADCLILETFSDSKEMQQAIAGARQVCSLPIIAQMVLEDDGNSLFGTSPEIFTRELDEEGADVIGVNCNVGPQVMLSALERMAKATRKKLSAQPNAGKPRNLEGRNIYLSSPDYMARYAQRFIHAGARIVGGCCGTTPDHIHAIRRAVEMLGSDTPAGARAARRGSASTAHVAGTAAAPPHQEGRVEQKSQLARLIRSGQFVTIVEMPPPRGCDPAPAIKSTRLLKSKGVCAISVPDVPRAAARAGAAYMAVIIQQQAGIETVLQYVCRDRNMLSMQGDLLGASAIGITNVLAVTGAPATGEYAEAATGLEVDSIGLTNILRNLNRGFDVGGNAIGRPTGFFVGVEVNPTALNAELELKRFQYKVEAGAEFAVTHAVFDVDRFLEFLRKIEAFRIPVMATLCALPNFRSAEFMNNEVPGVIIPAHIMERMRKAGEGEQARLEGIAIAREALQQIRPHVAGVQICATVGRLETVLELLEHAG